MNTLFLNLSILMILVSCGNKTEEVKIPSDFNSEELISRKNQLQNILTKQMVAKVANVPSEAIEEYAENKLSQKGQYTILYSWKTGKTKSLSEKHSIAEYNSIGIGFVEKMDETTFEKKYGSNEGLQNQINQMAEQENFNKEIATAEAQYLSDYSKRRTIEKLQNVATAAYWEQPVNALHVLADKVSFTITTNFGDDGNLTKENAIKLVNEILNQ